MAVIPFKQIMQVAMHSKTPSEPPLAAVPPSLDLLLFINYKEVPCSSGSSQPSTRVRIPEPTIMMDDASFHCAISRDFANSIVRGV